MKHNTSYAAAYTDQPLNQSDHYGSRSAVPQHLSSVPLRRRKEYQPQQLQQSQSLTLMEADVKGSKKTGGRSSRTGTKENTGSFSNMQYDFVCNQSQMLPPTSSSHMQAQSRKSARSKKKEKALERDKDLKLQALQLQFMQETLSKLQQEKQSRAEQLKSTLSRRNSSKGAAPQQIPVAKTSRTTQRSSTRLSKNGSQTELIRTSRASKNAEKTPRSSSRRGTQAAKAGAAKQAPRSGSRLSSGSQSRVRTHPRLCELSHSEMDSSAMNMPRQMATQRAGQEGASQHHRTQRSQSPIASSGMSKKQIKARKILKQYQKHAESVRKADLNQTGLTAQLEQSSARPIQRRDNADESHVAVRSFFKSQQSSMQHSMVMPTSKFKPRGANQLQMSQDQGGRLQAATQELLREDSEISELTREYEDAAVCEAPLQMECLDNAIGRSVIDGERHQYGDQEGASPLHIAKKCNQKDGKDSIDAFRSIEREPSTDQLDFQSHTTANKEEKHSAAVLPEAIEYHRRPQSQAQILPEPQIISERQLSSGGTQIQSSRQQQDIADFFEKEYKISQKELLVAKAHLYEQQFKTDILKRKIGEYEHAQGQMHEELVDLRDQLSRANARTCLCSETQNESQTAYGKDLDAVKGELLKIQGQSAIELGRYEQTVKQMTVDQATDLKKQRQFVKELVAELSGVESVVAASQLSDPSNPGAGNDGFEEAQRGKLACRFNEIYKTLKNLNDEIISRKKQLGRTTDMQKLLLTLRTSHGAGDTAEQSFNRGELEACAIGEQNTHDYLGQDPFRNQNYIDNVSQERSQMTLAQSREEPSSLKVKQHHSQNSVNSKAFGAQTQQQLQLMTSMNQNLVTEARTITNECGSISSASKVGVEAPTPSMGHHQASSKILDFALQPSQDQHLQQQQQLAMMVQKLQTDLSDVKTQSGQLLALNHTLVEENKELRHVSRLATDRSHQTGQKRDTVRSGCESDRRGSVEQQVADEENQSLHQDKKQLIQLVESLKTQQQSQDVMIQYLQGTQNSILQKMQHQVIKNQFSQSLVESAALATSFLQKDSLPQISNTNSSGEKYNSTISQKQTPDGGADGSSSMDLKYFMAQKQQDISQSIRAYEQERGNPESLNVTGEQRRIGDGSKYTSGGSSPSPLYEYLPEPRQRSELNIIDETAEKVYRDLGHSESDSQAEVCCHDRPVSCGNAFDAHQDYDSKTLSEHNRQYAQQQRGISPVGQLRKVDSRKSLSYQKQASSVKGHDMSVVSLSHLNSNSKQIPEQMRQLLRLQSSQDGTEGDRYQETGAFEKRSGEIRLFSLESTAQEEHLLPTEDLSGLNLHDTERGEMSPVKNFDPNDFQSNQLLNLVQCMQDAAAESRDAKFTKPQKPVQQLQSPHRSPSPEAMRQKIMFSAELSKTEDRVSQLSSPEMDLCITRSESGLTTQNQSIKTKEQREIEQIIAQAKAGQSQQAFPNVLANEYSSHPQEGLSLQARQHSSLVKAVQNTECLSQLQFQVKSPSFHQPDVSLSLPLLSKEETNSDEVMQDYANHPTKSSQEPGHGHFREQPGEQDLEVEHLMPRSGVKASVELPIGSSIRMAEHLAPKEQASCLSRQNLNMTELTNYDARSCTTVSASNRHNIRRSSHTPVPRALHNSALTSHETTLVDNFLQRENTQACQPGERLVAASLQHMPTQQYMPTQKMTSYPLGANQSVMYSPFKTHQGHFTQQGSFPFSHSRSTSPNQNEVSGGGLAASSERIQKRTKQMQQEIDSIDQEIAKLQSDISR